MDLRDLALAVARVADDDAIDKCSRAINRGNPDRPGLQDVGDEAAFAEMVELEGVGQRLVRLARQRLAASLQQQPKAIAGPSPA